MKLPRFEKSIKTYIIYGILFDIMLNLYKPFAVKFLERIGGTDFHISLFNALPGLIAVFVILPGSLWVRKFQNKKSITAMFFLLSRLFVLSFAFIPMVPLEMRPILFVWAISLMNFPEAVSQSSLQSFLGDLFPPKVRATAIALRSKFAIPAVLLVTLISGQILTKLPRSEEERILIYQVFFVIAFLVGLAEVLCFLQFDEKKSEGVHSAKLKETIQRIRYDKKFIIFLSCSMIFHFGWQMGWPLFNIYQIKTLNADEWWLALISIASSIVMFFSYGYWNSMIMKKGNGFVTAIVTLGMAVTPILYAISPNLSILTFMSMSTGFFTAGTATVLLSGMLEVTPEDDRVIYIGIYNTFVNISLTIAPIVGHAILQATNIYIALIVTAFLRAIGSAAFFIRNRRGIQ